MKQRNERSGRHPSGQDPKSLPRLIVDGRAADGQFVAEELVEDAVTVRATGRWWKQSTDTYGPRCSYTWPRVRVIEIRWPA